jgi:GNAT superfamily N-acetyltransferase
MKDQLKVDFARTLLPDNDIAQVHSLLAHLTDKDIDAGSLRQRLDTMVESRSARLYLARFAADIVGTASLTIKVIPTEVYGIVDDVVADPHSPVKGVGSALIQAITQEADQRGITLNLTCRPERKRAHHLYEKFGFVIRDTDVMKRPPATGRRR